MEPRILPDGSKAPPPLICPILSAAMTVSTGVAQNMAMNERLKGSNLVMPPSNSGPAQLVGTPCIQEKCGFWHRDTGACGVAAAAHILNIVGGSVMEKFFKVNDEPK